LDIFPGKEYMMSVKCLPAVGSFSVSTDYRA